ncbi:phage gp6-like head-tail connector protein [Luteibacter sp. PPL552]
MSLLSLDQAKAHCRVGSGYPDDQIQPYVDAAEVAAVAYLNRAVFASQGDLDAARDALPATAAASDAAYQAAVTAAAAMPNVVQRQTAIDVAEARRDESSITSTRVVEGIVVNAAILSAIRLTLGHLFTNREAVVVGAPVAELPLGATMLLRPYRRVMAL